MIVIVDYGMGNVGAIRNMLSRSGVRDVAISGDPATCARADKIILPGVGAFDAAMHSLEERGLRAPLLEAATVRRVPFLGICLGMQLLADNSEEGSLAGLGLIPGQVRRFAPLVGNTPRRVPHMGWNEVKAVRGHRLLADAGEEARFYFVHSYYFDCGEPSDMIGQTEYGEPFASAVARGHVAGVQFHPEKSHRYGMRLLTNFAVDA